jgi:hypothetical protein
MEWTPIANNNKPIPGTLKNQGLAFIINQNFTKPGILPENVEGKKDELPQPRKTAAPRIKIIFEGIYLGATIKITVK